MYKIKDTVSGWYVSSIEAYSGGEVFVQLDDSDVMGTLYRSDVVAMFKVIKTAIINDKISYTGVKRALNTESHALAIVKVTEKTIDLKTNE